MRYDTNTMRSKPLGHQIGQLVHEWIQNQADAQVRQTLSLPERLQLIRSLTDLLGSLGTDSNLDWEDVQTVLSQARGVWMGRTQEAGPERALLLAEQVWRSGFQVGPNKGPARELLLVVRVGQPLEMTELQTIIEAVQQRAGEICNVAFGYSVDNALGQQAEVLLLAGYD